MPRRVPFQILRGNETNMGTLLAGEFFWAVDTQKLYIGTASGNVLVAAAQTAGDMLKSIYDTDNDGKVDNAELADAVPWAGITGKPSTFPPSSHTHDDRYPQLSNGGIYGIVPSTASTMVGHEYNLLLNAHKRPGITITQTGVAKLDIPSMFDGRLAPSYTSLGIPADTPTVITIEGLPSVHTQTGGVIGWTSRYWYPSKFKIEGYNVWNTAGWKTILDQSTIDKPTKELLIPLYPTYQGQYTKLRFTIYDSSVGENDANGNKKFGLSEIFFAHPEAMAVFQYLDFMPRGPLTWDQLEGLV